MNRVGRSKWYFFQHDFFVKKHILASLTKKLSTKDICNNNYVSTTFARLMAKFDNEFNVDFSNLPEHLSFDEFKPTKYAHGTMSFIYLNSGNNKVLDILENRQINSQKNISYASLGILETRLRLYVSLCIAPEFH